MALVGLMPPEKNPSWWFTLSKDDIVGCVYERGGCGSLQGSWGLGLVVGEQSNYLPKMKPLHKPFSHRKNASGEMIRCLATKVRGDFF
jgi:hypothetical protein